MRDIPVFTTEHGLASLILKEIPYRGVAYVRIQDSLDPEGLIGECISFCRAVGAEKIYATGHKWLESYPLYSTVIRMSCPKDSLPDTDAALFPVQFKTVQRWRELYNERMKDTDNASYMSLNDCNQILAEGGGYFIHRGNKLLGIGIAQGDKIDAVISLIPGAGRDVLLALSHAVSSESISLEVASTNERAVHLYRSLGFIAVEECSRWYKIL